MSSLKGFAPSLYYRLKTDLSRIYACNQTGNSSELNAA